MNPSPFLLLCAAGLAIAALAWAEAFLTLLGLSVAFGLGLSVVISASAAYIADHSRREGRGLAMGLLGSIMDLGHTTGPMQGGVTAAWLGTAWSFWLAGAVLGLAAVGFWGLVLARPREGAWEGARFDKEQPPG